MRISDLMGCEVRTADGHSLGEVRDVRLVQDGPIVGPNQALLRVDAVVVGGGSRAGRRGYQRGGVTGPWLLRAIFGPLERRAHTLSIDDVEHWDVEGRVLHLSPAAQLEHDPSAR
jgi:hypothetical protein